MLEALLLLFFQLLLMASLTRGCERISPLPKSQPFLARLALDLGAAGPMCNRKPLFRSISLTQCRLQVLTEIKHRRLHCRSLTLKATQLRGPLKARQGFCTLLFVPSLHDEAGFTAPLEGRDVRPLMVRR